MTPDLLGHLPELEQALEEAERRAEALRKVVTGLRMLDGQATHVADSATHSSDPALPGNGNGHVSAITVPPPRGTAAVKMIMSERAGTWTTKQIYREFARRDWAASNDPKRTRNAITAAIYRMVQARELERVRVGVYRFPVIANEERAA